MSDTVVTLETPQNQTSTQSLQQPATGPTLVFMCEFHNFHVWIYSYNKVFLVSPCD